MARAALFRKIDIKRAIEAVQAVGVIVGRVEIEAGKIVVVSTSGDASSKSPLDEWLKTNARN